MTSATSTVEAAHRDVKTGRDLVEAGIKPKTSSRQIALIVHGRLQSLREHLLAGVEREMLGRWHPLFESTAPNTESAEGTGGPELISGVVADPQLGHRVRLRADDAHPQARVGTLVAHDAQRGELTIRLEDAEGSPETVELTSAEALTRVDVSSLGQMAPLDSREEIRKQVLADFFPTTVLDTLRTERIIVALLMGKDLILYGPPGGGKSNIAKDIVAIAQAGQPIIFTERHCQVQCNPFSIFDADFAAENDACPECKLRYDPEFRHTGRFRRPAPEEVQVKAACFGEGQGIEYVEGTVGLQRMHLAGHKIPRLDGSADSSDFDPEGFHAGLLSRTNNGILHLDEMEKLRPQTRDCLLDALNSERIKPEQLRYTYPAHALIIGTTNDHTKFSGAINDRMALLAVRYPDDVETSHAITRRGYHHQREPQRQLSQLASGEPHRQESVWLRAVPMPVILEKAVDALYLRFRSNYRGSGGTEVTASNRSKFDALDAARAKLMLERVFDPELPAVVGREHTIYGVEYAFCTRVQGASPSRDRKAKAELVEWVDAHFEELLRGEEDTWWCQLYKHIATVATQVPEIAERFRAEVCAYESGAEVAWANYLEVRQARENPGAEQLARIDYPLIDYLFTEQPCFGGLSQQQLVALLGALLESRARSSCGDAELG